METTIMMLLIQNNIWLARNKLKMEGKAFSPQELLVYESPVQDITKLLYQSRFIFLLMERKWHKC